MWLASIFCIQKVSQSSKANRKFPTFSFYRRIIEAISVSIHIYIYIALIIIIHTSWNLRQGLTTTLGLCKLV